ncbi:hypothetical protein BDV98DRAFT_598358 [Pterulicium gracile]|uniref:Hydrophobin n=1 Tax=Pterulicium gracile TaxID=1884261 RepID=A0A5C3Q0Q8_9AGAR|nr:hypothetical protein BDV98DRAFT_598358 [Pterula gracilis]
MFAKLSTVVLLAAVTGTFAAKMQPRGDLPHAQYTGTESNTQCSSGTVQCCNNVAAAGSENHAAILQALDGVGFFKDIAGTLQGNSGSFGLQCNPISAFGAGSGSACQGQTVCCDHTKNGGSIGFNCMPFNLNL